MIAGAAARDRAQGSFSEIVSFDDVSAHRAKAERLFAWLYNFRRLVTRYERHAANFEGFLLLGCLMILLRGL